MAKNFRTPIRNEQIAVFRRILFDLNFHRTVTMDHARVMDLLTRIDRWVGAHGDHNGERSEQDIRKNVNEAFWLHLAQDPEQKPLA